MKKELRSVAITITHMTVIVQNDENTYPSGKRGYCKHVMAFAARTSRLSLKRLAKCTWTFSFLSLHYYSKAEEDD